MQVVSLDETCLRILSLGLASTSAQFLKKALSPPQPKAVQDATNYLVRMGALQQMSENREERITPLGKLMGALP
eukprot:gene52564-58574_t